MMRAACRAICQSARTAGLARATALSAAAGAAIAGFGAALALSAMAATAAPSYTLPANGTLGANQRLVSPDGHYALTMKSNGDLVEGISGGRAFWSSGTTRYPGARAFMQVNGNLAIYDKGNAAVWSTNSVATGGCPRLVLQEDGNLVIYTDTKAIWAAQDRQHELAPGDHLASGWNLISVSPEDYRMHMNADGNLVIIDGADKEIWTTGTYGHPGAYAAMQTDGNLVVYDTTGHALWSSATNGHPGAYLDMLGDGNADIIYKGTVIWRSETYHKGTGGSVAPRAPKPVVCPAPMSPAPTVTAPPVVVTVPVAVPVPRPAPKLHNLRVKLTVKFTYDRSVTRWRQAKIGRFPGRTRILVSCRGRGCPRHSKTTARGGRGLHRVLRRLRGRRYRAGDTLFITLEAPGYRDERAQLTFRWGSLPKIKLLRR